MTQPKPFIKVRSKKDLDDLPNKLSGINFNTFSIGHSDKNGHPFIGLSFDRDPENEWSKKWDRVGIVWFENDALYSQGVDALEKLVGLGGDNDAA